MAFAGRSKGQTPRIFISYRRKDSSAHAGRIHDQLSSHFGNENVFMDVSNIEPGVDFIKILVEKAASCDVLIAVIGRQWLSIRDEHGSRRLDDPRDWVRREISAALERDVRVVPALVDGAPMPHHEELPESLKSLANRHSLKVSHEDFHRDMDKLIEVLSRHLARAPVDPMPAGTPGRPRDSSHSGLRRPLLLYWPLDGLGWMLRAGLLTVLISLCWLIAQFGDYGFDWLYIVMVTAFTVFSVGLWLLSFRYDGKALTRLRAKQTK